jgi:hypothetical protein
MTPEEVNRVVQESVARILRGQGYTLHNRMHRYGAADWVPGLTIEEADGSPAGKIYKLKVSNGTLTLNGDGSATITNSGGSGDVATDAIWDAAGDLAVGTGADTATRLTVGSNGQFLWVASGTPAWRTLLHSDVAITGMKRHIILPAPSLVPRITSPAPNADRTEAGTNDITWMGVPFDNSAARYLSLNVPSPRDWDGGVVTFIHHWSAPAGTGNVVWQVRGLCAGDNEAIDAAMGTTVTVTDAIGTTATVRATDETGDVTIAGTPAVGDHLFLEVFRDPAHASDTFNNTAYWMGGYMFYTPSGLGVS